MLLRGYSVLLAKFGCMLVVLVDFMVYTIHDPCRVFSVNRALY